MYDGKSDVQFKFIAMAFKQFTSLRHMIVAVRMHYVPSDALVKYVRTYILHVISHTRNIRVNCAKKTNTRAK